MWGCATTTTTTTTTRVLTLSMMTFSWLQLMWPAVRDALKQALAEDFTVETELAWKHVFDYIVHKMSQGMRRSDKATSAPPPSANGVPS